ncbi:hypothetical protein HUX88_08255 [Duganella sp. BJB1802]|uniref:hypothetical protein n=1 Tax=Duganella sp. BJB1802 TaxID=2744575 RepID=UPI0015948B42|nr:hypothetical protein [Duganella sp. BJB1802]NVD70551.1 hypothetical protein [Duganella sp. BJB1802]
MTTVFVAGSMSIKHLDLQVQERLMNIVTLGHDVVVGDADGVDTALQQFLLDCDYRNVTVFCTGAQPRNNVGNWPVHMVTTYHKPGTRAYFTAKDVAMAEAADAGLMIWDTKSPGTLSNVIELLTRKKNAWVFVNKDKVFHAIKNVTGLESLLSCMAPIARTKADDKIGLTDKLAALQSREQQMALLSARQPQDDPAHV